MTVLTVATVGVFRSFLCSIVALGALFVWIVVFQSSWRSWSGATGYMVNVPDEDVNNW